MIIVDCKNLNRFNVDAARLWNAAPRTVRNAKTDYEAKKAIVKNLPL